MRELPDDETWLIDRRRATGDRIRAERMRQNLTQDKVWLAAGVSRGTFQRAEAGHEVTVSTLRRIAWVLDVPLSRLIDEQE